MTNNDEMSSDIRPRQAPIIEIGDVVVSKFGNRWRVEAREKLTSGHWAYVLRNKPEEAPDAHGTVVSGMLPGWANEVRRNHVLVWRRPTPQGEDVEQEKA